MQVQGFEVQGFVEQGCGAQGFEVQGSYVQGRDVGLAVEDVELHGFEGQRFEVQGCDVQDCDGQEQRFDMQDSMEKLEEGYTFITNAPWSSRVAEQLHGSTAQVAKYHPDMGTGSLQARAFLHAIRALATPTSEEKEHLQLEQRLRKAEEKPLRRLSGRQMFLKCCTDAIAQQCPGDKARAAALRKEAFRTHAERFAALPSVVREQYERLAAAQTDEKLGATNDQIDQLRTQIGINSATAEEHVLKRNPFNMSNCKWGSDDLERVNTLYQTGSFSEKRVQTLRDASVKAPAPPEMDARLRISNYRLWSGDHHG